MPKKKTKICFLLLCHKDPDSVIEQIEYLLKSGGYVVVHIDKNSSRSVHEAIYQHFLEDNRVKFVAPVRASWGDWSLVNATLRMLESGLEFPDATHFYYLSGECVPIRSHKDLINDLTNSKLDFIETADFYNGNWIQTGPHLERVEFYHFVNERKHTRLFYAFYAMQRFLQIKRRAPDGLTLSIGSQWWCLRRRTIERMRVFINARPDVVRFFKRNWIPDEMFFQSLSSTLVPEKERRNKPPTFLRFSDYGLPTVFYNDHYNFLIAQEEYFARKISPFSDRLKKRLIRRFLGSSSGEPTVNTGRNTIGFHTYAGRNGQRFGTSFWERGIQLQEDARVYIVVVKKWHIGKKFTQALSEITGVPDIGYIFDEEEMLIGDLGGLETGRGKRLEEPVTFLRTIMETKGLNQVIFGADPSRFPEIGEIAKNADDVRILEIENQFSAEYLDGHAQRAGLMVQHTSNLQRAALHQTVLEIFKNESREIKHIDCTAYRYIRDWHSAKMRAEILASLFDLDAKKFMELTRTLDIRD